MGLFFSFGSYPGAETAPGFIRSPRCGLRIESRFQYGPQIDFHEHLPNVKKVVVIFR